MNNDLNFLFLLSVESVFSKPVKEKTLDGWQLFLAEARKRFLIDELLIKNDLSTENLAGEIMEVDQGISRLSSVLGRESIRISRMDITCYQQEQPISSKFALGVSHNQLEHFPSLAYVERVLTYLGSKSVYGMVHQVHAADDPAFEWDRTHCLRITGSQWGEYFQDWSERHKDEGWMYLGSHRGAPGRPKNFILEKNGSFPYYVHYDKQLIRRITTELTLANGISAARIPLLLLSFSLAGDNPYLLSGLMGVIHTLDVLDGYAARKGFGQSPLGPLTDVISDHLIEMMVLFEYAYSKGYIPAEVPWIVAARNLSTDILRVYNAFDVGLGISQAHPHEAFGTQGREGRFLRLGYGLIKALGDMTIPIIPSLGLGISAVRVGASISRAIPVWTSSRSQEIYNEILNRFINK